MNNKEILSGKNYSLDINTVGAFVDTIEHSWDFDIYSIEERIFMFKPATAVLDFFLKELSNPHYRIFGGSDCVIWNDTCVVMFSSTFSVSGVSRSRVNTSLYIAGERGFVEEIQVKFNEFFDNDLREDYQSVELAMAGSHGIEYATLPIKVEQTFYPLMYPSLKPDPQTYINDYLESSASVLILIGEAGMGKSSLINQIILTAKKRTHVVYDPEVMAMDQAYTDFINYSLQNDGGLMILEDADSVLSDRVVSQNAVMSKLLNISEGIIDTSKAKFIFTANIKDKDDIDQALTRPGRCFDILDFPPLTKAEAMAAAESIQREVRFDKEQYTVAEIFNSKPNHYDRKHKVGFI